MYRIGIDLGTTNSVVAVEARVCEVEADGGTALSSTVAYSPDGSVQVGRVARVRRAIDSGNTLYSTKRILGRTFDSHGTRNFRERYPFELKELEDGMPVFATRAGDVSPVDVATRILRTLVERSGVDLERGPVTLTVPASFSKAQREATLAAAKQAGLWRVSLLEEPVATALAYIACGTRAEHALVYDLGGGTFDCAAVDCRDPEVPVMLSHASDLMLGGDDLDQRLAGWVRHNVLAKQNWDLDSSSEVYDRLLLNVEEAKIKLSSQDTVEFPLGDVDPEAPDPYEPIVMTRQLLAIQCRELLQRSFSVCDDVLRQADLQAKDVDIVFLAGGSTLVSAIQEGVEAYFGRAGACGIDPCEVVAIGASVAPQPA